MVEKRFVGYTRNTEWRVSGVVSILGTDATELCVKERSSAEVRLDVTVDSSKMCSTQQIAKRLIILLLSFPYNDTS